MNSGETQDPTELQSKVHLMTPSDKDPHRAYMLSRDPRYRGEQTLTPVLEELLPLTNTQHTPQGRAWRLAEVVLVHDGGPDRSDIVIRRLANYLIHS